MEPPHGKSFTLLQATRCCEMAHEIRKIFLSCGTRRGSESSPQLMVKLSDALDLVAELASQFTATARAGQDAAEIVQREISHHDPGTRSGDRVSTSCSRIMVGDFGSAACSDAGADAGGATAAAAAAGATPEERLSMHFQEQFGVLPASGTTAPGAGDGAPPSRRSLHEFVNTTALQDRARLCQDSATSCFAMAESLLKIRAAVLATVEKVEKLVGGGVVTRGSVPGGAGQHRHTTSCELDHVGGGSSGGVLSVDEDDFGGEEERHSMSMTFDASTTTAFPGGRGRRSRANSSFSTRTTTSSSTSKPSAHFNKTLSIYGREGAAAVVEARSGSTGILSSTTSRLCCNKVKLSPWWKGFMNHGIPPSPSSPPPSPTPPPPLLLPATLPPPSRPPSLHDSCMIHGATTMTNVSLCYSTVPSTDSRQTLHHRARLVGVVRGTAGTDRPTGGGREHFGGHEGFRTLQILGGLVRRGGREAGQGGGKEAEAGGERGR